MVTLLVVEVANFGDQVLLVGDGLLDAAVDVVVQERLDLVGDLLEIVGEQSLDLFELLLAKACIRRFDSFNFTFYSLLLSLC